MRTKGPLPKPSTVYPPTIRVRVNGVVVFGVVDKFKLLNPALFFPNPTLQWFQRLVLYMHQLRTSPLKKTKLKTRHQYQYRDYLQPNIRAMQISFKGLKGNWITRSLRLTTSLPDTFPISPLALPAFRHTFSDICDEPQNCDGPKNILMKSATRLFFFDEILSYSQWPLRFAQYAANFI